MKITKLIPAALALLTLASCSNDELLGDSKAPVQVVKDGLTVAVDDINFDGASTTRQGNTAAGAIIWEIGDQINVYDNQLQMYDEYAFTGSKFEGQNDPDETNLSGAPAYALFPADRVDYAGNKKAVMSIPELIIYDEESEFGEGTGRVYVSNLPLWGTATGAYPEANVNLHLLTSVLRINIKNAFADNINFLKVEAQDGVAIQGAFEADLSDPENAVLKQGGASLTTGNVMYVDLRGVPSYMTYLYLPIISREYDYLKVYTTDQLVEATPIEANSKQIVKALKAIPNAQWTCIRNWEADGGVIFEKGKGKSLYKETQYDLENVNTTEELSEALKMYAADYLSAADKDQTQDAENLVLTIGSLLDPLAVTRVAENYKDDYTIYVPKFPSSIKSVTINIPGGISAGASVPAVDLQIVDADIKDCYGGKVIINATQLNGPNPMSMTVNLPETSLTIDGNFTGLDKLNIKNVKNLTFGNGEDTETPATTIDGATIATVNCANSLTIAGDCQFNAGLNLIQTENINNGGVTIEEGGRYTGTGAKSLKVLDADVRVLGIASNIYQYASKGTIYIGATKSEDGLSNGQVDNVLTIGKVYIANKEESEAITQNLSPLGNNTITLKQGYIKKISYVRYQEFSAPGEYNVKPLGDLTTSDKDAKVITIKLDEIIGDGLTAIAEIEDDLLTYDLGKYNFVKMTTSKWGGATIDATTYPNYVTNAALTKVYTASELASIENVVSDEVVLYNNLDLDTKTWANPVMKNSFDGLDPRFVDASTDKANLNTNADGLHTISNLYLDNSNAPAAKQADFGLFGEVAGNAKRIIQNFILDGVTSNLMATATSAPANVGAVAGKVSETRERQFKNITVKNANFGGDASYGSAPTVVGITNIGALIGLATDGDAAKPIIISNNNITATITGQAYMGGIIGKDASDSDVNITMNTVNTSFSVPLTLIPTNYDMVNKNFGTVGNAVGQFDNYTSTLTIAANNIITDNVTGNRDALGFKFNFVVSKAITAPEGYMQYLFGDEMKYAFYGGNPCVGYSPDFTATKLVVGTQAYEPDVYICNGNTAEDSGFKKLMTDSPQYTQNAYVQWTPWAE